MRILFVFGLTVLCAVAGRGGPLPVLAIVIVIGIISLLKSLAVF